MKLCRVTGVGEVVNNLRLRKLKTEVQVQQSLKKAGLMIQRWSQKIVPVDKGILRNSAWTRAIKGSAISGFYTVVGVGYTADYAIYVHERLDLKHKPPRRAKFLESVVKERLPEIIEIVKNGVKKGML